MARTVAQPKRRLAAELATLAGTALRKLKTTTPGIVGAVSIAYGAGLIYKPAGFIVAGLFLLLLDRRSAE